MNKKLIKWLLQIVVTGVLLFLAFRKIDLDALQGIMVNMDLHAFIFIPLLLFADLWVNSYRILSLYRFYGVKTRIAKIIHVKLQGMFFALLFPLVGDAYKIQTFKNIYGASYQKNTLVVLLDRLIYTFALTIILIPVAISGLIDLPLFIKLALSGMLFLQLLILILVNQPTIYSRWVDQLKGLIPFLDKAVSSFGKRTGYTKEIAINTLTGIIRHTIMGCIYLLIAYALMHGISFAVLPFFLIVFFIMLSRVIPISVGGIGLREYIAVIVFPQIGISADIAFSIALIISTLMILQSLAGGVSFLVRNLRPEASLKDSTYD